LPDDVPATDPAPPKPKAVAPKAKRTPKPAAKTAEPPALKEAPAEKPKATPTPRPAPVAVVPAVLPEGTIVVDASGLVLGRAASLIAQKLLHGQSVVVVNAEKSVVTGARHLVLRQYAERRARGSVRSGPHFPRYPDRIFRRTVRGMLPHLKTRGKLAFHRLSVHIGVPPELANSHRESLEGARAGPSIRPILTLEEITRLLGARL
jgi:large subunit ribosomal protein L13